MTKPKAKTEPEATPELSDTLPCVACGKELETALPGISDGSNQPAMATTFISYGQYGSTVWDPIGGDAYLEVNICDVCMTHAGALQRIIVVHPMTTTKHETKRWKP